MSRKDPKDAQRPRTLHKSRPSRYLAQLIYFRAGFLVESFNFKQFKWRFFEIFPQVSSNYL